MNVLNKHRKKADNRCKLCGSEIIFHHGRPKTWCSIKCKNKYNNQNRKSTKRTKQIKCKTCGRLSINEYCNKLCYPKRTTWQAYKRLRKGYANQLSLHRLSIKYLFSNDMRNELFPKETVSYE